MKLFLLLLFLFTYQEVNSSHSHRPMDLMADLTNDLGICILQMQSTMQNGNVAFSPYGIASMTVLLFEGASGNTALEIMRVMNLPWNVLFTRVGFRDINRHLKTYFKSDGFLRGLIMSRDDVCFHQSYQKLLRIYGFEEPDKALTYPCKGFIPYSPAETAFSSSTIESITNSVNETVTLTSAPTTVSTIVPTTTIATEDGNENVVTELTQTSQTVLIFNSTTFKTVDADITNEDQKYSTSNTLPSKATDNSDKTNLISELNNKLVTNAINSNTILDITAASSNTVTDATINTERTTNNFISSTMEMAESTVNEQKFTRSSTQRNAETRIPTNSTFTTKSSSQKPFINSIYNQKKVNSTSNISGINTTILTPTEEKLSFNKSVNEMNKTTENNRVSDNDFHQFNLSEKNFTLNFKFPTINTESIDKFLNNRTDEIFGITDDISFDKNSNYSITKHWNTANLSTGNSLLNDSVFVSLNTPFLSSTENNELDFNQSTAFYSTLVNFIESATQTIKDFVNFDEPSTTSEPTIVSSKSKNFSNSTSNYDTTEIPFEKNSTVILAAAANKTGLTNSSSISTLANEKNYTNLNKNNSNDIADVHNLPKKSISANNEENNAAVSLNSGNANGQLTSLTKPNNYLNIVSLKRSKLISSNYNIKGPKSKKHLTKRSVQPLNELSNKIEIPNDLQNSQISDSAQNPQNTPVKSKNMRNDDYVAIDKNITGFHKPHLISEKYNYLPPLLVPADDYDSDYRKIRSYGRKYYQPFETDWFSISDQNIVRTPIFTYSAILPYAHIEDLKTKVLEIPLDDENYSLLLFLPTSESGLNHLMTSLRKWPIRKIYAYLRGTPIFAAIPKFSIVSHVNLKPAVYGLGIRSVFHRYLADLSIMSPDARLFVRSIEQVVTIRVDKFYNRAYPIPEIFAEQYFLASYPFLYFVIDKETTVSLVAGIMADPTRQNVRFA